MQEVRRCPMCTLFYLSESQLERNLFFPRSHGVPRVDDRRVSAASSTSSSMDFSGRMHLMSTARTKRCIIAL